MTEDKPLVQLWPMGHEDFVGIIVPCASGVRWTNQVGGTCCDHPEAEGIFVPLPPSMVPIDRIEDATGLMASDVQAFLDASPLLAECFEAPPEVRGNEYGEAWVPLVVRASIARGTQSDAMAVDELLAPFAGLTVILTYANSD